MFFCSYSQWLPGGSGCWGANLTTIGIMNRLKWSNISIDDTLTLPSSPFWATFCVRLHLSPLSPLAARHMRKPVRSNWVDLKVNRNKPILIQSTTNSCTHLYKNNLVVVMSKSRVKWCFSGQHIQFWTRWSGFDTMFVGHFVFSPSSDSGCNVK